MKITPKKLLPVLLAISLLGGCSQIPDKPQQTSAVTSEAPPESDTSDVMESAPEDVDAVNYDIEKEDVLIKLNAEGGEFSGVVRSEGEYDGSGYIVLDEGQKLLHMANIPSSQHYRIVIAAQSYTGAVIKLSCTEGNVGMYYIPASDEMTFVQFSVDRLYLAEGMAILNFEQIKGTASLDYILIEDSDKVPDGCYRTAVSVVGNNTGISTISTMKFLSDSYGIRTITGQNVTLGTNAEIDAIYKETGRYPAMRCGDLMYSSIYAPEESSDTAEAEIQHAIDWGKDGGMISMGWHWYSPLEHGSDIYKSETLFDLGTAVTTRDIANASIEEIQGLYDSAMISESCLLLIKDIDNMAQTLKRFKQEQLSVIWQPIPDGDSDIYWWGGNAENYKWLWNLMFTRMNKYHNLNNLIWVWNGTDPAFYPGDEVCDIVGQGMFNNSSASFAARFEALARISPTDTKAVAITSCDKLPDPNYLRRDNAMWMWFSPASGEYVINEDGSLSEKYTSWQSFYDIYNSRLCITRDELPDMLTYGMEYMLNEEQYESTPQTE